MPASAFTILISLVATFIGGSPSCAPNPAREAAADQTPATQPAAAGAPSPSNLLLINERISDRLWATANRVGGQQAYIFYEADIDPKRTGFVNLAMLRRAIERDIPRDFAGYATLDLEVPYFRQLKKGPGDPEFDQAQEQMVKALRRAKELRPNARWSMYGIPQVPYWNRDDASIALAKAPTRLLDEMDWMAPSCYDLYRNRDKAKALERDEATVRARVQVAREIAGTRPVIPYVWRRFHHNGRFDEPPAYELIDRDEFQQHVGWVVDAGADGVVWWGWDDYYIQLAASDAKHAAGSTKARQQTRWRTILADEIPPGVSVEEYLDLMHLDTLYLLAESVRGVSYRRGGPTE